MKKITFIVASLLLFNIASFAQKVGDKVQIEHNGSWYDGKILKVNPDEGEFFVSYDGWSESWNEWVGSDRLKGFSAPEAPKAASRKYKVGDRVEVEYGMIPEPATVMEVGENKYRIKYDKKVFGEKWVTEGQIKKL